MRFQDGTTCRNVAIGRYAVKRSSEDWPLQFVPISDALEEEAYLNAEVFSVEESSRCTRRTLGCYYAEGG